MVPTQSRTTGPDLGAPRGSHSLGAVAPVTGDVLISQAEHATTTTFIAFLNTVRQVSLGKEVHLILNNAKIHHAKALQPDMADHPDLA